MTGNWTATKPWQSSKSGMPHASWRNWLSRQHCLKLWIRVCPWAYLSLYSAIVIILYALPKRHPRQTRIWAVQQLNRLLKQWELTGADSRSVIWTLPTADTGATMASSTSCCNFLLLPLVYDRSEIRITSLLTYIQLERMLLCYFYVLVYLLQFSWLYISQQNCGGNSPDEIYEHGWWLYCHCEVMLILCSHCQLL